MRLWLKASLSEWICHFKEKPSESWKKATSPLIMSACLTWKISRAESSPHDRPGAGTAQPSLPISWSPVWREADHHFFLAGSQARSLIGIKVGKLSMFSMGGSPSNRLIPAYHQRIPPTLAMVPATAMPSPNDPKPRWWRCPCFAVLCHKCEVCVKFPWIHDSVPGSLPTYETPCVIACWLEWFSLPSYRTMCTVAGWGTRSHWVRVSQWCHPIVPYIWVNQNCFLETNFFVPEVFCCVCICGPILIFFGFGEEICRFPVFLWLSLVALKMWFSQEG